MVNAANDYQKEKQFRKLNAKKEDREVRVLRNGLDAQLSVFDLVVGDVVHIETGEIVPADGIFIDGQDVRCDESGMTGESDAIRKAVDRDPFMLSGTKVLDGIGTYVVIAVGPNSLNGKTLLSLQGEVDDTPLQKKLEDLAESTFLFDLSTFVLFR